MDIVGPTLATVRQARGLRQVELADAANLSQGLLSKLESSGVTVDETRAGSLAEALRVTTDLLTTRLDEVVAGCTHFRKRASLRVSDSAQIRAELALRAHALSRLRDLTSATPATIRREPPSADGYLSASEIARRVRADLDVAPGPVHDLFALVEAAGCALSTVDQPDLAFDAASVWAADGTFATMLINTGRPTDRIRFSTAHELAHAVMHSAPSPTAEQEADEFASEFLMPAHDIVAEFDDLTFSRLTALKSKWRVSMAALIRRAFDLGAISDRRYRSLSIELSKAGYRTNEPIALPPEEPRFAAVMLQQLQGAGTTLDAIAAQAGLVDVSELLSIAGCTNSEAP